MSNDDAGIAADIAGEDAALEALEVTDVPVSADESGESSLLAIVVGEDEEEKDDDDAGVRALGGRRWQSIDDMTDAVKPFCLRRGFGITPFYVAYLPITRTVCVCEAAGGESISQSTVPSIGSLILASITISIPSTIPPSSTSSSLSLPPSTHAQQPPDGSSSTNIAACTCGPSTTNMCVRGYLQCEFYPGRVDKRAAVTGVAPVNGRVRQGVTDFCLNGLRECTWRTYFGYDRAGYYLTSPEEVCSLPHKNHRMRVSTESVDRIRCMKEIPNNVYEKLGQWILGRINRRSIEQLVSLPHTESPHLFITPSIPMLILVHILMWIVLSTTNLSAVSSDISPPHCHARATGSKEDQANTSSSLGGGQQGRGILHQLSLRHCVPSPLPTHPSRQHDMVPGPGFLCWSVPSSVGARC